MLARRLEDCREFVAADGSVLRELLHPARQPVEIHYSLAHAKVVCGERTLPHRLISSELYYVLAGQGMMYINQETRPVGPGCAVYIPPGSVQSIESVGNTDLVFLCIVDPAWRAEDEDVLQPV